MSAHWFRGGARRRWMVTGLLAGLLAGAAAGAAFLSGAAPDLGGPRPIVLHAAPAIVEPGRPVELAAATFCPSPGAGSCDVANAVALIRVAGSPGWTEVPSKVGAGVLRFQVPAELVPDDGFSYWFRLTTADGATLTYPPGGAASAIRVVTTVGLPVETLGAVDWDVRQRPTETLVRLRPGSADGRAGFVGGGSEDGLQGPSSFDVGPGGDLFVADWANDRIERFGPGGRFRQSLPLPVHRPVDLAVGGEGPIVLTTLGVGAQAMELGPDGSVLGRYPVGYGVVSRIVAGDVPRVRVGSAQWVAVRAALGVPIRPDAQAVSQTSSVPLADGAVGVSQDIEDGVVAVWTRPDGSRAGATVRLPRGVSPGADYFVRPLPDGGAVMARGLWDDTHFGIGVFRFDASGRIRSFELLPEPTPRMGAPYSTIRFLAPGSVLLAVNDGDGIRIDRFPIEAR